MTNETNETELELEFVKHYAPNCLTLTLLDSNNAFAHDITIVKIFQISMLFY